MAAPRVNLKLAGIKKVLKSAPVQAEVDRVGRSKARAAGPGFEYAPALAANTSRGYVRTADARGRRRQATEHVIEGVIGDSG